MANLSLREAAKQFDVSRPTLQKALKSGKISGVQDESGHWQVDPSELARVYRPRSAGVDKAENAEQGNLSSENKTLPEGLEAELRAKLIEAEQRAAVAEATAEERARFIEELRKDKEVLRAMLPAPDAKKRKGWWPF